MTQTIPAHDHGRVYLYALPDRPDPDIAALLGVQTLDLAHVDVIRPGDLEGLGLRGYLTDGMGVPGDQIGPEVAALTGAVVVVRSAAFGGRAARITLAPGVRHVATYDERQPETPDIALRSDSATAPSGRKPAPGNGAILGRVAMVALAVILALTFLMVWIA